MEDFSFIVKENFLSDEEANILFNELMTASFFTPQFRIRSRNCLPKREMLAFSDPDVKYSFSGRQFDGLPWTPALLAVKEKVEKETKSSFNFLLVNRYKDGESTIGAHKDNEKDLNPDVPIATISLGATRKLCFKRFGFQPKNFFLKDKSLYIMAPPTNIYWTHEIGREPHVKDARISLTFRNIIVQDVEKMNSSLPPVKKRKTNSSSMSLEEDFNRCEWDNLFINIPPPQYSTFTPVNSDGDVPIVGNGESSSTRREANSDVPSTSNCEVPAVIRQRKDDATFGSIYKKELEDGFFLTAELFREVISVHIRRFNEGDDGYLIATRQGLNFNMKTWYDLCLKLSNFNFNFITTSFVANNDIIVYSLEDHVYFQRLFNSTKKIRLSRNAFRLLIENVDNLNESIINFKLGKLIPHLIRTERKLSEVLSSEEDDLCLIKLRSHIEADICSYFDSIFICNGCLCDRLSQNHHECLTNTNLEKYLKLGENVLLLFNAYCVVREFLNETKCISEYFVENISPSFIRSVLFY